MPPHPEGASLAEATVLVTGAGGFIGSSVAERLVSLGARVRALAAAPGQAALQLPVEITPVFADIRDSQALARLATGADVAIHLAGPPAVQDSFHAPLEYGQVHAGGTLAVLEACRAAGVSRLVYVSSAEVYGRPEANPVAEEHPLDPRSPYAAGKAAAEHFVRAYAHAYGMEVAVLRPFSVYGPRLRAQSVMATVLRQVLQANEVVVADLAPVRDYCFVDDVVDGVLAAASARRLPEITFNLGSGIGTSVGELVELALRLAGRTLPVRTDPARRRPGGTDLDCLIADRTRAGAALGWRPRVSLDDGVGRTLAWMGDRA